MPTILYLHVDHQITSVLLVLFTLYIIGGFSFEVLEYTAWDIEYN